jgi:hypothetical protein
MDGISYSCSTRRTYGVSRIGRSGAGITCPEKIFVAFLSFAFPTTVCTRAASLIFSPYFSAPLSLRTFDILPITRRSFARCDTVCCHRR